MSRPKGSKNKPKVAEAGAVPTGIVPLPEGNQSEARLNLDMFPTIPEGWRPRRIFFRGLTAIDAAALVCRGYEPIDLLTLPRNSDSDHTMYLYALLQGSTDGTIPLGKEERASVELEMRSRGMLDKRTLNVSMKMEAQNATVTDLLNWGRSRHTLQGNTTIEQKFLLPKEPVPDNAAVDLGALKLDSEPQVANYKIAIKAKTRQQ